MKGLQLTVQTGLFHIFLNSGMLPDQSIILNKPNYNGPNNFKPVLSWHRQPI